MSDRIWAIKFRDRGSRNRTLKMGRAIRAVFLVLILVALGWLTHRGFFVEPFDLTLVPATARCSSSITRPVRVLLFSDVAFERVGRRENALLEIARDVDPDIVLIAGDLINRFDGVDLRGQLDRARAFLEMIPARFGRFLVPGEDESPLVETLQEAWHGTVDVLSNERRLIDVGGGKVDLFGAHPRSDRVPWPLGRDGDRGFVYSRPRTRAMQERLVYTGEGAYAWKNVEITLAFLALERRAYLDIRFAWNEGGFPEGGAGWRITRHEKRADFKLYTQLSRQSQLRGRMDSGFVPPAGVWCRVRIRFEDDGVRGRVRARFWKEGDAEPEAWAIDAYDEGAERFRMGTIALGGRRGIRKYADLRVTDEHGRVLLQEDFRDKKEFLSRWFSGSALEGWAYGEFPEDAVRIVLAHEPDIAVDVADLGEPTPCMTLAGHTHGGQVRIPGVGAIHVPTSLGRRFDRGLFDYRGIPLYITAGVGTSLVPVRLYDPPEVTLLTLMPEK